MRHALLFCLFLWNVVNGSAQDSLATPKFGFFINANAGFLNAGHGINGSSTNPDQFALMERRHAFERGMSIGLLTRSGLMFKADLHRAVATFDMATPTFAASGDWNGLGRSIGLGYGDINGFKHNAFYLALSINIGRYRSEYTFINRSSLEELQFGEVIIQPGEQERFYQDFTYLDLNAIIGMTQNFSRRNRSLSLVSHLSTGLRQGLAHTRWLWGEDRSELHDVKSTQLVAWYVKASIGFGSFPRGSR